MGGLGHKVDDIRDGHKTTCNGGGESVGAHIHDADVPSRPGIHRAAVGDGGLEEGGSILVLGRSAIRLHEGKGIELAGLRGERGK